MLGLKLRCRLFGIIDTDYASMNLTLTPPHKNTSIQVLRTHILLMRDVNGKEMNVRRTIPLVVIANLEITLWFIQAVRA